MVHRKSRRNGIPTYTLIVAETTLAEAGELQDVSRNFYKNASKRYHRRVRGLVTKVMIEFSFLSLPPALAKEVRSLPYVWFHHLNCRFGVSNHCGFRSRAHLSTRGTIGPSGMSVRPVSAGDPPHSNFLKHSFN